MGAFISTDDIILDGLTGADLHKGHMLVGRCVVDNIRAVLLKDLINSAAVPDGADDHLQVQAGILLLQFLLDIIGIVFINIKNDELLETDKSLQDTI